MKYRKKPIVIDAVRWSGDEDIIKEFVTANYVIDPNGVLFIETLEGWMLAPTGDWIIKGIADEFYSCRPDIFEQSYEAVEENVSVDQRQKL